ncbi:mannose-1-phosphate guanylyltransferase [Demequina zhanjiangensis]|uniref:Sugar phosphate nucleotidyltransferase n=1 Tax=Demequina zhanjiangensis TaxID=3051659 RepID=A0ABT8G117_9MICO|nr:sugar phosphate nucleotidyltransferase [Demequina sp. SYSU T00b26]MDN4472817.1 sugar phosphate nucleotidyltransferase [Demequina sp. SYSU T00b26]
MTHATPALEPISDLVAVVPAGGVGSRLWPLSQPTRPKFLLDLLGTGSTLIQDTVTRLSALTDEVYIVTGARHADAVAAQVPQVPQELLIAEPSPRDSMAAIALAAAVIEQRRGPSIMGSFAADHVITETQAFAEAVATAVAAARTGKVVTIGIEPTEPSSAFGYIRQGSGLEGVAGAMDVREFTEKPDPETAAQMLADGGYVWNAGMFVVSTDVLLGHLARLQPTLAEGVRRIAAAWDGPERAAVLDEVWPTLTKIAIDHAIAEPVAAEGGVAVVPASLGWHDIGDFDSLASMLTPDAQGVISVGRTAPAAMVKASGATVVGGDRPVVVVGVDDAVVVETDEALLVTTRQAAQAVKDAATSISGL